MATCPGCGSAAVEGARFCVACGSPLAPRTRGDVRSRKTVTVVFSDVTGFTTLSERLDPEALQLLMNRYFGEMREVIERHGGTVEKFIGDAVMAVFGVPRIHEDDVVRAARAALEMRAALDALNRDLAGSWDVRLVTHTGVNTGEIAVTVSEGGEAFTLGDPVNVAERLESAAGPGEILVGPMTERLLRGSADLEPVPPLRLKGKTDPVAAWRLLALGGRPTTAVPRSPLVGRARDLAMLSDAFVDVIATRRPRLVTVIGAAGIGKSRLARELLTAISPRAVVAVGRCVPYGEGITYRPLAEIVRALVDGVDEDAIAGLTGDDEEGRRVAARIARLVGAAPGPVTVEEAHWAVRRLLEIAARDRPLVVVVDDLHWAEPTLLDALEHVAAHATDVPMLVVCLARPEVYERRPEWRDDAGDGAVVTLGPLDDDAAAGLLAHLATDRVAGEVDGARLLATAEGNPFFLEQMVAMLDEPGHAGGLPPTIQALLAARIDALPSPERAVLDRAAVEGGTFHRGAIARLLPAGDARGLEDRLAELTQRQLIRPGASEIPGEIGYRFAHILIREVAYELVSKAARVDLHEGYAAWLEGRDGDTRDELVGYHLERAHHTHAELHPVAGERRHMLGANASKRLARAGRAALDRGDLPAGVNLLERATTLLPEDDPDRARTAPDLGLALVHVGRLADAADVLEQATRRADARGEALAAAHAQTARFFARVQVDSAAAAEELGDAFAGLSAAFSVAGDDIGLARLWRARGLVHWLAGQTAAAEADWILGADHSAAAGDEHGRADALAWIVSALALGPTPVPTAIARCERILEDLAADRYTQGLSIRPLAHLHAMAGRFAMASDLLARSNATLSDLGVSMHSAVAHDEALIAMLADDPAAAEAALRLGYERLEAMGERALLATTAAMLARALLAQGRDEEAWDFADAADANAAPDDLNAHMIVRGARARLLARRGDVAEAERLSREAVDLAARTDWIVDHGDVLLDRAAVLRAAGDANVAIVTVREALALYERKGNVTSAGRARSLIGDWA